jgi:DNA-binding transcriptional MerR regulator
VSARTYLSIGDVLTLLRQEFPDVTISKIRFLESQGLVNPERTPSGYRKFYDHDVERLRWVLRQQREHFLPLKVIKGRLEQEGDDVEVEHPDAGVGDGDQVGRPETGPAPPVPALVGSRAAAEAGAGRAGVERGAERAGPTLPGFETHPANARPSASTPPTARARPAAHRAAPAPDAEAKPAPVSTGTTRSTGTARATGPARHDEPARGGQQITRRPLLW